MPLYSEVYFVINRTSTCFGHHYAHHQENNIVYDCMWLLPGIVLAVVVWSWDVSGERVLTAVIDNIVLLMMGIMMPETC